jgi:hypothetical protein
MHLFSSKRGQIGGITLRNSNMIVIVIYLRWDYDDWKGGSGRGLVGWCNMGHYDGHDSLYETSQHTSRVYHPTPHRTGLSLPPHLGLS